VPRRLSRAGAAGAFAVAAALLAGCTLGPAPTPTPTPPPPSGDGVLRIGTLLPAGSALSVAGVAAVNAAVRDIATAGGFGGVPLEVTSRDGGDPAAGFADLVARGVDVVIGPADASALAELVPLARESGVLLVSPAADGPRPADSGDILFRTISSARAQGAAIAGALGVGDAVLVRADDPASRDLAAGLGDTLAADVVLTDDVAAAVAQVAAADPGHVVISVASAPLLSGLQEAGIGAERLWLTRDALTGYDEAAGALEGAHGIQADTTADPAFTALLRREDPAARAQRYAAAAYDATVLVALAALVAGDDGAASIAAALPAVAAGGIRCHGFGECAAVRDDGQDIAYAGRSGAFGFDAAGDRDAVTLIGSLFDADNRPVAAS